MQLKFDVKNLVVNPLNSIEINGFSVSLFHRDEDPVTANRIGISNGVTRIELQPSKGLSVGQAWFNNLPVFWEAPIGLPDTETIDLWSDEVKINGNPAPGFTFLKTFCGGFELYGLNNWGMPKTQNGELYPLHGETSNIPVDEVEVTIRDDKLVVEGKFMYRSFKGTELIPWYKRGDAIFVVARKIILDKGELAFRVEDTILNISSKEQVPDWGYHITFRPEEGAKLLVPSKKAETRGGGNLPIDIETWHTALHPNIRTETGIIHKGLQYESLPDGSLQSSILVQYPESYGIIATFPVTSYFQTWFCNGGESSGEFTYSNGDSLLQKNWDGIGIEIGSSALDHDGNTDPEVPLAEKLKPGEKILVPITIGFADSEKCAEIADQLRDYYRRYR